MTNIEKYGKTLKEDFGIHELTGHIMDCQSADGKNNCYKCRFTDGYDYPCEADKYKWLFKEYKEPEKIELTKAECAFIKIVKDGVIKKYDDELLLFEIDGEHTNYDLKQFGLEFNMLENDRAYNIDLLKDLTLQEGKK